jgi:4-hydroxyacetophenone monooxygenase
VGEFSVILKFEIELYVVRIGGGRIGQARGLFLKYNDLINKVKMATHDSPRYSELLLAKRNRQALILAYYMHSGDESILEAFGTGATLETRTEKISTDKSVDSILSGWLENISEKRQIDWKKTISAKEIANRFERVVSLMNSVDGRRPDTLLYAKQAGLKSLFKIPDQTPIEPPRCKVAVIGAGLSGVAIAKELSSHKINFDIFDSQSEVGGVWARNQYPGCRADIQSLLFSFADDLDFCFDQIYPTAKEFKSYLEHIVDKYGFRKLLKLNSRVKELIWNQDSRSWGLVVASAEGDTCFECYDYVVLSSGQLSIPHLPKWPIRSQANLPRIVHSSVVTESDIVRSKEVILVGSAASAIQLAPHVAKHSNKLTIIQRTPNWIHFVPYLKTSQDQYTKFLLDHAPFYVNMARLIAFSYADYGWLGAVAHPKSAYYKARDSIMLANRLNEYFEVHREHAKRLDADGVHIYPTYSHGAKRLLYDNGDWIKTLVRDNVDVVNSSISWIDGEEVVLDNGSSIKADTIIAATGFKTPSFLRSVRVSGIPAFRQEDWCKSPSAYAGVFANDLPNLFIMHGPNTNAAANGSNTFFSDIQAEMISKIIIQMNKEGKTLVQLRKGALGKFCRRIKEVGMEMPWEFETSVPTWYRTDEGGSYQNWPFSCSEYHRITTGIDEKILDFK